jgi:hypothetical protein
MMTNRKSDLCSIARGGSSAKFATYKHTYNHKGFIDLITNIKKEFVQAVTVGYIVSFPFGPVRT